VGKVLWDGLLDWGVLAGYWKKKLWKVDNRQEKLENSKVLQDITTKKSPLITSQE